jgi:hypothetical protein
VEIPTILASADARWHPLAACARAGPDGFYDHRSRAARRLCSTCPVSEPCLWAALAFEQVLGYRYGIWGGTSAARRARIVAGWPEVDLTACYLAVVDSWALQRAHRPAGGREAA